MQLHRIAAVFLGTSLGLLAGLPPNTGQNTTGSTTACASTVDTSYAPSTGCAFVVSKQPSNWGKQTGALWIGPSVDATTGHPASDQGNFIYTLSFTIVPADLPNAKLTMSILADPDVDVNINGNFIAANTTTATPRSLTLTADLVAGKNTIQFLVSDIGSGPVGLNVLFGGDIGGGGSPGGGQLCTSAANIVALQPSGNAAGVGTGTNQVAVNGVNVDTSFCIFASDITDLPAKPAALPTPAIIANPVAGGWGPPIALTNWVAPTVNQTNAAVPANCCAGTTTYQAFVLVPDPSKVNLLLEYQADDSVTIALNGQILPSATNAGGFNFTSSVGLDASNGLIAGSNLLIVGVKNASGPTGLDVNIRDLNAVPPGKSSRKNDYSLDMVDDPVDSATGQFYETELDLRLGGIVPLSFSRYYSSALGASTPGSALGPNWMSNFDLKASVSGNTASVLLAAGKVVTFTNVANVWQLKSPLDVVYQFAQSGASFQLMNPASKLIYTFDATGALIKIEDRNGNALTITRGTHGPTAVADGTGRTLTFTYTDGLLTKVVDQSGRSVSFGYTDGALTSATDPLGNITTYSYSFSPTLGPLMTKKQLPLGNVTTVQTYDAQGRVISQADANEAVAALAYDATGGSSVTNALSATTKFSSANGVTTQVADAAGGVAKMSFDSASRRTSLTDKLGNTATFGYQPPTGGYASATDLSGNGATFTYASQVQGPFTFYNLTKAAFADSTSITMTYDTRGNVTSSTGTDGSTRSTTYDANGRITKVTDPNGQSTTYTVNADGTLGSVTDSFGDTTAYTYNAARQVASITAPNGGKTSYTHDALGRILTTTDPVPASGPPTVTTNHYNANGQRDSVTTPSGGAWNFAFTLTGRYASMTDPLKNKSTYAYDTLDRLTSLTGPSGEKVAYAYDAANRVLSVADNAGVRRSYTYTAENRIATATDATSRKTSYTYDALGHVTATTTPGGNVYSNSYDKRGRLISSTNPLGEVRSFVLDALGRPTQVTAAGGISISIQRDAIGRATSVTSPNGNSWTFAYDTRHLTKTTDPLGNSISYTYAKNQLASITYPLGTETYANDLDGRVTKRAYSDGTAINTAYDASGLVVSGDNVSIQRDIMERPTSINGIGITYDASSRVSTVTYASGKTITYTYDNVGRLASVADWVNGKSTFSYDAAGRITAVTYANGVATANSYDADGRIAKIVIGTLGSITMTRDGAGKIVSATRTLPLSPTLSTTTQQFTYNAASQLNGATYDKMGRVTSENARTYNWNLASQLTSFNDAVDAATLAYDALGEINSKTSSGVTQSYVFNFLNDLPALEIVRSGNADVRYYVYTPSGSLLYSIEAKDNSRHFYHFDELGNTVLLTDNSGAVSDSYGISPYGEIVDHAGTSDNPFTWQGQSGVFQEGRGLYFMRQRHYDASAARFVSPDAKVDLNPRSAEPYVYANSNPMEFVDPTGASGCAFWDVVCLAQEAYNYVRNLISPQPPTKTPPAAPPPDPPVVVPSPTPPLPVTPASSCDKPPYCAIGGLVTLNGSFTLPGPFIPPPVRNSDGVLILTVCSGKLYNSLGCLQPLGSPLVDVPNVGLLSSDSASLITNDGGTLITNDGGTFAGPNTPVIINGVAGVISNDGGSIVSHDSGTLVAFSGSGLLGNLILAASIISDNSEGLIATGGGNLIASGGGNLIASGGGN